VQHPLNVILALLVLLLFQKAVLRGACHLPLPLVLVACLGVAVGGISGLYAGLWCAYVRIAQRVDAGWLGAEDSVIVCRDAVGVVVGVLVMAWGDDGAMGCARVRRGKRFARSGKVRAWTVCEKERGKGVGRALLKEAVRIVGKSGGGGLEFEQGGICEFPSLCFSFPREGKWKEAMTDCARIS